MRHVVARKSLTLSRRVSPNVRSSHVTWLQNSFSYTLLPARVLAPKRHYESATIRNPYSYATTYDRFPHDVDVRDVSDRSEALIHQIPSVPLANRVPVHGVLTGARDVSWRANAPATLMWSEALDGGDWKVEALNCDKMMALQEPFHWSPAEIMRSKRQFDGIWWPSTPTSQFDLNTYLRYGFLVGIDNPGKRHRPNWDLSNAGAI